MTDEQAIAEVTQRLTEPLVRLLFKDGIYIDGRYTTTGTFRRMRPDEVKSVRLGDLVWRRYGICAVVSVVSSIWSKRVVKEQNLWVRID